MKKLIRERLQGRPPDRTIQIEGDVGCVVVARGSELPCLIELGGDLYEDDIDIEEGRPLRAPVTTLGACEVGSIVFAKCSKWVASPIYWTRYEIMSETA